MKTQSIVLLVAAHLVAGGEAVVQGGEPIASAWTYWQIDDGPPELLEVKRKASPGIRCTGAGGPWFVATSTREQAQQILDRAIVECDAYVA